MPTKAKSAAGQSVAGLLLALACVLVLAGMVLPSGGAADAGRPGLTPSSKPIGPPQRLVVPAIGLGAPVTPIEVNTAGVLDPPAAVDTVGWWQRSAEPGDTIRLRAGNRMAQYRATRVVVYSRAELADNSRKLFGQDTGSGRLVLVTCTDWNGASYDNNVVVFARPVRGA
jgi:hypothetical protein